ncbi:MAG: ribosome silencing factor [Phycisphaerae bacterium]|nr:ribosome silencing factor [Phycisphaerae bacterium]
MTKTKARKITARQLAIEAARIAHDRHGEDIVVLDLRGISPITDYFVIFTGTSGRQMTGVADEIADDAAKVGHKALHVAGLRSDQWVLLDFFDVIVHIFDEEHRKYYDLELIWGDAPRVRWKRPCKKTN